MSLVLVDTNALFLHIPKTGGIWVERALAAAGIGFEQAPMKAGVSQRHALAADLAGSYEFSFTFVRHPLQWYESWWKFVAMTWPQWEPTVWHPQRDLEACAEDEFPAFIENCIERQPAYVTRMYEWYVGAPGLDRVQFVGHQEHLADSLIGVLRGLGYGFDEQLIRGQPSANVSDSLVGAPIWPRSLRADMEALERPAIERFYGA